MTLQWGHGLIRRGKASEVATLDKPSLEFGTSKPLTEAGGKNDCTTLLDDRQRPRQSLDRLIPRCVKWIAGAARDDDVERLRHRHAHHLLDEAHALLPRLDHVAGADPRYPSLTVEADV